MPSLDVVICSDGLLVHAPVFWQEHRASNPLASDVGDEVLKGLCVCSSLQTKEHRADLAVRKEGKGHQLSDVLIHTLEPLLARANRTSAVNTKIHDENVCKRLLQLKSH